MPQFVTLRSSRCSQVQGRGRQEELKKSKRVTGVVTEAKRGHKRNKGEHKMYNRGTQDELQMYCGGTAAALHRTKNT